MKRKTTVITEEFNEDGKLISRTTETREEKDSGFVYPQYPFHPNRFESWEITCDINHEKL